MAPADYPPALKAMISALRKLPGIGPRSAERMAVWLASGNFSVAEQISVAATAICKDVRPCSECGFFSASPLCDICSDTTRDRSLLAVVENAPDVIAVERTGSFQGLYHVLSGRLSPLDGIGPTELGLPRLEARVLKGAFSEVILAVSADVEGEATAAFIASMLKKIGVRVTRIAHGLPAGAGLDSADRLTLNRAFAGRLQIQ